MATLQQRPAIFDQEDDSQYRPHVSSVPPSPTLSNPDMILPDEGERQSQTPSPPFNLPSLSHLQAFYGGGTMPAQGGYASAYAPNSSRGRKQMTGATAGYSHHQQQQNNNNNVPDANSIAGPIGVAYSLSNSSSSNLNNYTGSTSRALSSKTLLPRNNNSVHRLSDIGEEEGPSPPPKRVSSQFGRFPVNAPPAGQDWRELAASQARAVENKAANGQNHHQTQNGDVSSRSSSSNSTISGGNRDSLQQQQQQQQKEPENQGTKGNTLNMGVNDVPGNNAGGRDEVASAVLSNEAERILENAKKRLTLMEGNLTRARSSMRNYSPSMSPSPQPAYQSMGLGQPVGGLYRSVSSMDRQASAALRPRPMYSTYQDAAGNRHSRVLSENNLPSPTAAQHVSAGPDPPSTLSRGLSRSVSALGSTSTSSFQREERSFRYDPNRAYLTHHASTPSLSNSPQPPRSKTCSPPDLNSPGLDSVSEEKDNPKTKISTIEDFNSVYPADYPTRTQSQMQVHDLRDQMKGLHIKISSLKVKTQEDGIRRRSLQSLRTPSPLTAADPWFVNAMDYRDKRGHLSPNPSGLRTSFESARESRTENGGTSARNSGSTKNGGSARNSGGTDAGPQISEQPEEVAESLYEDAEEGDDIDREELDEILREPLDDDLESVDGDEEFHIAPQDATPHEEREDAFDYEHFILHSALGNYSRSKLRRANSNVSNASVETTRPARARSTRSSRSLRSAATRHSRANSATSLSTAATFATAAEGETDFNGVLYWDRKFNDELRGGQFSPNGEYDPTQEDENVDSETPTGTPRAAPRRTGVNMNTNNEDDDSDPTTPSRLDPPVYRSGSANNGSATPTALASSLVSTVRAASGSPYPHQEHRNSGINNDDERLLELLFQSLGNVCMDLQTITTSAEPDDKEARILRRRLDAARRVLDGELDA